MLCQKPRPVDTWTRPSLLPAQIVEGEPGETASAVSTPPSVRSGLIGTQVAPPSMEFHTRCVPK